MCTGTYFRVWAGYYGERESHSSEEALHLALALEVTE
jgi:hypothetical protein